MCTPSGIQDSLWHLYGVDPDDRDEGAYVGYGEFDDEFRNNGLFDKIFLYHNLGDYKRCRVRAVLERAGFVVNWDDSELARCPRRYADILQKLVHVLG